MDSTKQKGMTLFALGFRPFYGAAALLALAAIAAWLASFTGRLQLGGALAGTDWHGHEMIFGFASAVIAGFLLTASRNWTGLDTPTGWRLATLVLCWLAARVLLLTGPEVVAVGVDLLFLPLLAIAVGSPILRSRNARNVKVVVLVLVLAAIHAAFHLGADGALPSGSSRGMLLAAIGVIAILFALIGGRIVPAFTRNAVPDASPRHLRWLEIVTFVAMISLVFVDVLGAFGMQSTLVAGLLAAVAAMANGVRLMFWQPWRTMRNALLWMLPAAYAWLPVTLLLRAIAESGALPATSWVHAMTAGAITSMMLAMMMRSTLGHTGRALAAGGIDVAIFLLAQVAALLRVLAPLAGDYRAMVMASGVAWLLTFALFCVRYLPMLVLPRIDGKPG